MGTMARHATGLVIAVALFAPATIAAGEEVERTAAPQNRPKPAITGGHDQKSSWLAAEYRDLQVRKRTDRASRALTIDLHVGADHVNVAMVGRSLAVSRGGRTIVIDSPEALESVQHLLGGSAAVFAVRSMLSELESVSELRVPDMSLLSTAAFVASIVGDVGAPQRIADRFMEKHRGIFRQVQEGGQCWSNYSTETAEAWDELQGCMADADDKGFIRAAYERLACNAVWLLRAESAYFEFLKCLSPLGALPQ